ncbi:hypothetical protein [Litorihabitans aurantiacus]|uniref:Uncharacterized protein n=1 Tax=Litorihabitans aurantiacus TaxID=1930061 RepID=A0AA38CPZ0_9MICO|nr:hypothetical protein [Litorihabitans aurantiacus]GMA32078.1 hypothetical protein GCM10025875_20700 [Litorihabitans aurantiacus]
MNDAPRVAAGRPRRPWTVVVAAALLALQGLALVVLTAVVVRDSAGAGDVAAGLATAAFTVLLAAAALAVAVGLWRCRRWSRGPAVAWSVLVVLVGASQIPVNAPAALAIVAIGVLGTATAGSGATRAAVTDEPPGGPTPPSR